MSQALDWDVSMGVSPLFAVMNGVAPLIPEWLYRSSLVLGLLPRAARRWFGMGDNAALTPMGATRPVVRPCIGTR